MNAPPYENPDQQPPRPGQPSPDQSARTPQQPQRDIYGNVYGPGPAQPPEQSAGWQGEQAYVQSPERPAGQRPEHVDYGTGYGAQPASTFEPYRAPSSADPHTPPPPTGFYGAGAAYAGQGIYAPQYGQQGYGVLPGVQYADVGIRCVAILIDSVVVGALSAIVEFLFGNVSASSMFGAIVMFLYFIIMEATWGATLGKMAMKLRVVRIDGAPISWQESAVRNLLRIVDGLAFYLVGAIAAWSSPIHQRLGDRAARTVVIRSGM